MKIEQTVDTVRESNLEKISFFCDAKKQANIFEKIDLINRCINKTDYPEVLEIKSFLMLKGNLFFRWKHRK